MKTFKYLSMAAIAATSLSFASCSDDDDNSGKNDKPSIDDIIEDGFYISGEALPFTGVDVKGRMISAPNEIDKSSRDGFVNIYMTLESNKSFTFTEVKGSTTKKYGPSGDSKVEQTGISDNYEGTIFKGLYTEGTTFKVDETGLYHITIDQQTKNYVIVPVKYWSIIGASTEAGWADNNDYNILNKESYAGDKVVYSRKGVVLKEGEFKFRYSGAWKQYLIDGELNVNTNFSGTAGALSNDIIPFTNLTPGGDNAKIEKEHRGIYTVSVTWELGKENFDVLIKKTGDAVIADYPEELWLRGDGLGAAGWESANSKKFVKVPDNAHLFWCIAYLEGGKGIKMDPSNNWNGDFGASDVVTDITSGKEYGKGGSNIVLPDYTGYYIVSVDLKEEKIAVINNVELYLIGDEQLTIPDVNNWDEEIATKPEFKFEESGEELISPVLKTGVLRMFARVPYINEWWQREFNVADGSIVHREGGEIQNPAQVTAGQRAYMNFKAGSAEIK